MHRRSAVLKNWYLGKQVEYCSVRSTIYEPISALHQPLNATVKMTVLMMVAVIRSISRTDVALQSQLVATVMILLKSQPALSLYNEPSVFFNR